MKFRVLIARPVPPELVPEGITLPPDAEEVGLYFFDAQDRDAVVAAFEKAQQSGLAHLQGRHIKSIDPVLNGRAPDRVES
jgi:hypothetical protein